MQRQRLVAWRTESHTNVARDHGRPCSLRLRPGTSEYNQMKGSGCEDNTVRDSQGAMSPITIERGRELNTRTRASGRFSLARNPNRHADALQEAFCRQTRPRAAIFRGKLGKRNAHVRERHKGIGSLRALTLGTAYLGQNRDKSILVFKYIYIVCTT